MKITDLEVVEKIAYFIRTLDGGRTQSFRVEAVRGASGTYFTLVYQMLEAILQPAEIAAGKQLPPQHESIWVRFDAPWTSRASADEAIEQLISLMS